MSVIEQDVFFLRQAIDLAMQARREGNEPFGALLVKGGEIIAQGRNGVGALHDPTAHAELRLISDYCRKHQTNSLQGVTLYSSCEPCMMCCGAVHWSGISRVVFSVSQAILQEYSGDDERTTSREMLERFGKVTITGPLIPQEGRIVFEGYSFSRDKD